MPDDTRPRTDPIPVDIDPSALTELSELLERAARLLPEVNDLGKRAFLVTAKVAAGVHRSQEDLKARLDAVPAGLLRPRDRVEASDALATYIGAATGLDMLHCVLRSLAASCSAGTHEDFSDLPDWYSEMLEQITRQEIPGVPSWFVESDPSPENLAARVARAAEQEDHDERGVA